MRNFTITFEDTKLIRNFEGHSLTAYPDPATKAEPYTISYGITGSWVKKDTVITEEQSKKIFMLHIEKFCSQLDKLITVELNKNQYLAVLSLTWNIGIGNLKNSTLLKLVNIGEFEEASKEFRKWNKANKIVMPGLTRRRLAEEALFCKPI